MLAQLRHTGTTTVAMGLLWLLISRTYAAGPPDLSLAADRAVRPQVALADSALRGRVPEGYGVGNFGIAASVRADGLGIAKSLLNPPEQGKWLRPFATSHLNLISDNQADFTCRSHYVVFPEDIAELTSRSSNVEARVETFSPITAAAQDDQNFVNFMPAVVGKRPVNDVLTDQAASRGD